MRCLAELYKKLHYFNRSLEILAKIFHHLRSKNSGVQNELAQFAEFLSEEESPNFCELIRRGEAETSGIDPGRQFR